MSFWSRWLRYPQTVWARRALFQVHLWTGIGVGLYVLAVSVSGSMLVYRPQLSRALLRRPPTVVASGERMTPEELKQTAQRAYPEYRITQVVDRKKPDQAVEVWFERDGEARQRLFDPYTGADLGDTLGASFRSITWLLELHDNLLYGRTGRFVNGVGGIFLTLLSLTGAILWWPGIRNWRRSLTLDWKAKGRLFHWSLHSALGFWFLAFVFLWGLSGIYLCFPEPFNEVVEYLQPLDPSSRAPRLGDMALFWLSRLHFGRFYGWPSRVGWVILGLVPPALFVTGALMWWIRTLGNNTRQSE